jgi:hypothetical protein
MGTLNISERSPAMNKTIVVGLDVHAELITAAILKGDHHEAEVMTLSSDLMKVRRFFRTKENIVISLLRLSPENLGAHFNNTSFLISTFSPAWPESVLADTL